MSLVDDVVRRLNEHTRRLKGHEEELDELAGRVDELEDSEYVEEEVGEEELPEDPDEATDEHLTIEE